jgi:hypothetical protein
MDHDPPILILTPKASDLILIGLEANQVLLYARTLEIVQKWLYPRSSVLAWGLRLGNWPLFPSV